MAWKPDYCTVDQLKLFVKIEEEIDDTILAMAISSASRAVDRAANRQFGTTTTAVDRYYTAEWDRRTSRWLVSIDDVMDVTGLAVTYDGLDDLSFSTTLTGFAKKPLNAAADGIPYTELVLATGAGGSVAGGIKVHAIFGWTAVPSAIVDATLMQANRFLSRMDSPFGVAGSPEAGTEMRLLPKLDPDVALAVRSYYRWWGAA